MRYEDSMKGVADQIIKEQQRVSKIKNNPEEFHWHDEYATLNLGFAVLIFFTIGIIAAAFSSADSAPV